MMRRNLSASWIEEPPGAVEQAARQPNMHLNTRPKMRYVVVPVTPFQQNCTIIWCPSTLRGAVVDPGGEVDRILDTADEAGVKLEKVLLTHGHLDHAGGAAELAE